MAGIVRSVKDAGGSVYAAPFGEPVPSLYPWPEQLEVRGVVLLPCHYIIKPALSYYDDTFQNLKDVLSKMKAGSSMTIECAHFKILAKAECFSSVICAFSVLPASSQAKAAVQMERYWQKNRERNRPLSPHLTIYKLPVTAVMSISNRITGCILTAAIVGGPIVYLLGSKDYAGYLQLVQSWGPAGTGLLGLVKFSLAFSFSYHTIASIRHLAWDMVWGFQLPQIAKTGYAVLFFTFLMTAALMCM